jgi:MFS family permease
MTGTVLAQLALPVLVYTRTGSALLAALTFATSFLPYLVAGTLLSAVVDRVPTRRLLVGCNLASMLVALGMAAPGTPIAGLLLLAFALGLISPLFQGGRAATLREAVPGPAFVPGRSLIRLVSQGAQIGGFAVSGLLLTVVTPRTLMVCNAVSFAVAAVILRLGTRERLPKALRAKREAPQAATSSPARVSLIRDSFGGIRRIFAVPRVRRLMIFMWAFPALAIFPEALAVPYVLGRPGGTALGAGLLLTAVPVGTFAGEALATSLASPIRQIRLVRAATALLFVPLLAFAPRPDVAVAIALLVVSGLGNAAMPGLDRITIEITPADLLPRTLSIQSAGLMFWVGIGYAAAGGLAQFIRPGYAIVLAGCCGLVVVGLLAPGKPAGTGQSNQDSADPKASPVLETTAPGATSETTQARMKDSSDQAS